MSIVSTSNSLCNVILLAVPKWKKVYNWACGFSESSQTKLTRAQKFEMMDISENPFWSRVCDVNAVLAVAVTCFIIGFYA